MVVVVGLVSGFLLVYSKNSVGLQKVGEPPTPHLLVIPTHVGDFHTLGPSGPQAATAARDFADRPPLRPFSTDTLSTPLLPRDRPRDLCSPPFDSIRFSFKDKQVLWFQYNIISTGNSNNNSNSGKNNQNNQKTQQQQ